MTPEALCTDREEFRDKYIRMFGWPLTEYTNEYHPNVKKELIEELDFLTIYRLNIETLPGLWFTGMLFVPTEREENAPLVIINPGGSHNHGCFVNTVNDSAPFNIFPRLAVGGCTPIPRKLNAASSNMEIANTDVA